MMTIKDIMKELKVSRRTVYTYIHKGTKNRGKLPHIKIGGIIRIREEDYQEFIGGGQ